MSYSIRKTQHSDIESLAAIERSAGQTFKTFPDLALIADGSVMSAQEHRHFIEDGLSWATVETASQDLVGFLTATLFSDEFYIAELSVSQDHQQKGLGSKLIQTALNAALALDMKAATLTTFIDVPWNAPYYERLGFVILTDENMPSYLKQILQMQKKEGLPLEKRCAMRKVL